MSPADGETIGLVFLGIAALMTLFAAISYARLVPRNRIMGFRSSDALQSDVAWNAGQEAGAPWMLAAAGITALTGLILMVVDLADAAAETTGALGLLLAVVVISVGWARSSRAARSAHQSHFMS